MCVTLNKHIPFLLYFIIVVIIIILLLFHFIHCKTRSHVKCITINRSICKHIHTIQLLIHLYPLYNMAQSSMFLESIYIRSACYLLIYRRACFKILGHPETSSPTGWLHMWVWRMSWRRMKSTIISWDGSNGLNVVMNLRFKTDRSGQTV